MSQKKPNIVAVDVGYGNVKYATVVGDNLSCGHFPAVASLAKSGECISAEMRRRNTVVVEVGGVAYEVGNDAQMAIDSSFQRVTDEDYATSAAYEALLLGALAYSNTRDIDLLVLGLPLLTYTSKREELVKRFEKKLTVPRIQHANSNIGPVEIDVKRVLVMPQPMGGLFSYASTKKEGTDGVNTLVVDVGYFTVDWLTVDGYKPFPAKSNAIAGGMSAAYRAIAESIRGEFKREVNDLSRIEAALRTGADEIRLYGNKVDLKAHIQAGIDKARQYVGAIANSVGNGETIDQIVVVGGGANFILPLLKAKYPDHTIDVLENPIYSNAVGFYHAGARSLNSVALAR